GDVLSDARRADRLPGAGTQHGVVPADQPPGAGAGEDFMLVMPRRGQVGEQRREDSLQLVDVRRNKKLEPVLADYLLALPACQPQKVIVAVGDPRVAIQ